MKLLYPTLLLASARGQTSCPQTGIDLLFDFPADVNRYDIEFSTKNKNGQQKSYMTVSCKAPHIWGRVHAAKGNGRAYNYYYFQMKQYKKDSDIPKWGYFMCSKNGKWRPVNKSISKEVGFCPHENGWMAFRKNNFQHDKDAVEFRGGCTPEKMRKYITELGYDPDDYNLTVGGSENSSLEVACKNAPKPSEEKLAARYERFQAQHAKYVCSHTLSNRKKWSRWELGQCKDRVQMCPSDWGHFFDNYQWENKDCEFTTKSPPIVVHFF